MNGMQCFGSWGDVTFGWNEMYRLQHEFFIKKKQKIKINFLKEYKIEKSLNEIFFILNLLIDTE